jgi:hypothetical protein
VGIYVRLRAKYGCVVFSSLVRLDRSHEHAQRGKVYPVWGGRFPPRPDREGSGRNRAGQKLPPSFGGASVDRPQNLPLNWDATRKKLTRELSLVGVKIPRKTGKRSRSALRASARRPIGLGHIEPLTIRELSGSFALFAPSSAYVRATLRSPLRRVNTQCLRDRTRHIRNTLSSRFVRNAA